MAKTQKRRRSRGSGYIFKQESGNYAYQYIDGTGRRRTKSLRTKSRQEAEKLAKDFEKAVTASDRETVLMESAKARKIIETQTLPLGEVWNAYRATRPTASLGTQENHRRHLNRFLDWLAENCPNVSSITQVDDHTANDYAEVIWASGMSASTANYHRASLHCITAAIARRYGIERNPWASVPRKEGERQHRQTLTAGQLQELLAATGTDAELHTLMLLGAHAGMRLKDAALLRWRDVDLATGHIQYRPAKTRRRNVSATVPVTPDLRRALENADTTTEYVLPRIAGQYLDHYDALKKSLLAVIRTVSPDLETTGGGQHVQTRTATGFHALRHYFCSTCANRGIPAAQLERMTGDQSKTLNQYYVRGEIDAAAVSGALTAIPEKTEEPEREQLHQLADELPVEAIRDLLRAAESKQTP